MSIRTALDHTRRVHRGHTRLIELQNSYENAPNAASQAVTAENIADRLDSQAEHLEASWLARATTMLPSPTDLRGQAREWRATSLKAWGVAATESDFPSR